MNVILPLLNMPNTVYLAYLLILPKVFFQMLVVLCVQFCIDLHPVLPHFISEEFHHFFFISFLIALNFNGAAMPTPNNFSKI